MVRDDELNRIGYILYRSHQVLNYAIEMTHLANSVIEIKLMNDRDSRRYKTKINEEKSTCIEIGGYY